MQSTRLRRSSPRSWVGGSDCRVHPQAPGQHLCVWTGKMLRPCKPQGLRDVGAQGDGERSCFSVLVPGLPSPSGHPRSTQGHMRRRRTHTLENPRCSQASALKGPGGVCPRAAGRSLAGGQTPARNAHSQRAALSSRHRPPCAGQPQEEEDSVAKGGMFLPVLKPQTTQPQG